MSNTAEGKPDWFGGRVDPESKAKWEAAARQAKRTLSDWIRIVCDEAAEDQLKARRRKRK